MSTKKKLRERVLNKFGGRCAYCGIVLDGRWHMDHMIPIRRCLTTGKPTNPEHDVEIIYIHHASLVIWIKAPYH